MRLVPKHETEQGFQYGKSLGNHLDDITDRFAKPNQFFPFP
jgi:hypothetical protein